MLPLDAYSPDYRTARSRFRAMLAERGWSHEAHAVPAAGFAEGDLTIDVGRIGPADAEQILIVSSGLHGVEGVFGSAVQLGWLGSLPEKWRPPAGCAVVLLHALNPFGFAHDRRANEENVDLNRNFLDSPEFGLLRERTAREFAPLDPYLNPHRPVGRIDWFGLIFPWMALRFGLPVLHSVMPAGQYEYPKGIFYGGTGPCRSTRVVMDEMPRWIGPARFILHLDFHTGLGKYGAYNLLASDPLDSERHQLARELFGHGRVKIDHETEGGYHNHGDMGEWLSRRFADRAYLYFCAEFGTYGTTRVIGALRRENQAHHWGPYRSAVFEKCKAEARETFVPTSPAWRWPVVHQSVKLIHSSIRICADQGNLIRKTG
jgi:hypothetical protein